MNNPVESFTESSSSLISLAELPACNSTATLLQQMQELRERLSDLEQQNEELRQSQLLMNAERARYFDFYNMAAVGFLSISAGGLILDANQTAASLLGVPHEALLQQPLSQFILKRDQNSYYRFRRRLKQNSELCHCDLRILRADGTHFWAHLVTTMAHDDYGEAILRIVLSDISEHRQTEEALRKNQAFNIAVLNSLSEHIAVLDQQAVILAVNVAWQQLSQENGVPESSSNPVGVNYFSVCQQAMHGPRNEQAEQAMAGIQAVLANRQFSFQMEYSCDSEDEQRWFLMHVTALQGAARCAVVSHLNISQRKQAEEALRASESQNRALLSAIPDLIFTNARDGEYLSVHASNPAMLAAQPEQLLHRKPADILPGQVADLIMHTIAKVLETGVVQEVHYALVMEDCTERFFSASVARYTTDTTIAIVRDITELERERQWREAQLRDRLRLSESDLRASQESLALAGEAAKLGVWVLDMLLEQVWASGQWRSLFGFTSDEPINMDNVLQRIHPDDRTTVSQALGYAQLRSDSYQVEFRIKHPDGRLCWIASVGHLEFHGQTILSRGVSLDITQRKQAELELQQKRIEVMHLSRVAMLGELSGALAHELNQPLTAILSNAQAAQRFMVQERVDLNQLGEILRDIVQEDKRAGEIIRRLRLLFKQGETLRQSVDLNFLVLEVADILRHDLIIQGVTLRTELMVEHPVVNADRVQLQQVLINLVMNACDAMKSLNLPQQPIVIRTAADDCSSVQISVIDRGTGIPIGSLEEIFKPFVSTKAGGMGLGLSICRNIIGSYGGELRCENNQNGGARFYFSVPLQVPEAT